MALRMFLKANLRVTPKCPLKISQRFSHFTFVPDTVPASEGWFIRNNFLHCFLLNGYVEVGVRPLNSVLRNRFN